MTSKKSAAPVTVAVYARFSTDTQDQTSVAAQITNCEALCAREGLRIGATFSDEARSGNDDQRPNYQRMLAALRRGEFAGIACDETSRATRNQAELHRLAAELRFRDQFLITADGIDTRNENAELLLSVRAAIDSMEGKKIGYRTYRSLRERHKGGHVAGGRVYGYGIEPDGDYKRRVVDPEQARIVLEIFTRYAAGESAKRIVRDLNERRVPSPGSAWKGLKRSRVGWVHTTVLGSYKTASGILRNRTYAGVATWNKLAGKKVPGTGRRIQKRRPESEWIEHRDESLRIVTDELWNRVQARLEAARHKNHPTNLRSRPARHLLSGFLVCGACGASYTVRNGRCYGCSSHTNGRDSLCTQRRYLERGSAERRLLTGIEAQLSAPDVAHEHGRRMEAEARQLDRSGDTAAEIKALDQQIADLADTIIEVGKSAVLTAKLRELETRKRALARSAAAPRLITGGAKEWRELVSNLGRLADYATPEELETARTLLGDVIDEVVVVEQPDGVIAYVKPSNGAVYNGGAQERTLTGF